MPHKVQASADGIRVTVNALVKNPTLIPKRLISDLQQEFISDAVLRKLPPTTSGSYVYEESTPLFADDTSMPIIEEFGEFPVITGQVGERKVAFTLKRGAGVVVSEEMRRRNDMDRLNTQITQARNTMTRTWETTFLSAVFNHPDVLTRAAAFAWSNASSTIRKDLALGAKQIKDATPTGLTDNYFGFKPDTLIIGHTTETDLLVSDDFNKALNSAGPLAAQNTGYTGTLTSNFFGFTVMLSRELDRLFPGKALLLQRRVVGGIGDERPLWTTPLKRDDDRETYRTNMGRQSAVVIDQPKSALVITGV